MNYLRCKKGFLCFLAFVAVIVAISLVFSLRSSRLLAQQTGKYESTIAELQNDLENAYDKGYEDGASDAYESGSETYFRQITDMTSDEICAYLEESSGSLYWSQEEASGLFAYAFQRGYETCRTNSWDATAEEYLCGYELSESDIALYDFIFGIE